jgi:hypothetical protein
MEAKSTQSGRPTLPLRPEQGVGDRSARLVILTIDERLGLSAVPILRGRINNARRGALTEATRQIATAIKESRPLARLQRPNVQDSYSPSLWEVLTRNFEGIELESSGL